MLVLREEYESGKTTEKRQQIKNQWKTSNMGEETVAGRDSCVRQQRGSSDERLTLKGTFIPLRLISPVWLATMAGLLDATYGAQVIAPQTLSLLKTSMLRSITSTSLLLLFALNRTMCEHLTFTYLTETFRPNAASEIKASPSVIHFSGFEPGKSYSITLVRFVSRFRRIFSIFGSNS